MKTSNELNISKRELEELKLVSKDYESDYNKVLKGYPIQYLIGYVNFYGYKINVNKNVLIPRYETELLVDKTINYIKKTFNDKVNILDIGTGSGCISIVLNKEINSNVTACDISDKALEVAKNNSKINDCSIKFINSDIFKNIDSKYDVIISNPPYIDKSEKVMEIVDKYEPHEALYASNNGLYFYEEILKNAKDYLNNKFIIAFEIGWWQANLIKSIAESYFKDSKILIEKDYSNRDRYLFIINE
jgi:release factor glutamine methyltransferase